MDHVENKSGISVRLMGLKMLIIDEADHLLDLGFRKDMEKIVDCLPRQRQSLLFSATMPKEVKLIFISSLDWNYRNSAYHDISVIRYDGAGSPDISACFKKRTCFH